MPERRRIITTNPVVHVPDWRDVLTPDHRVIIGIDPGAQGGLGVTNSDPHAPILYDRMPEENAELWAWLRRYVVGNVSVYIEAVSSSPQMGCAGAFTFGMGYGRLLMAITALGIVPVKVQPAKWQRALQVPKTRKPEPADYQKVDGTVRTTKGVKALLQAEHKEIIRQLAQRLYPSLEVWSRTKKEQMSVCDAVLICHYGKLMECGNESIQSRSGIFNRGEESSAE